MLRDYQQKAVNEINKTLINNQRACFTLATGGGKTFIFSYLASKSTLKTLILVNREELLEQTMDTLVSLGNISSKITSKTKEKPNTRITVGMVETVHRRYKDLNEFEFLIIDECHRLEFAKVLDNYKGKVLGCSATPLTDKVEYYHDDNGTKWRRKLPLSKYYHNLVQGAGISELLDKDMLVRDKYYVQPNEALSELKTDQSGEFSKSSEDKVFNNKASLESVLNCYLKYCKGEKTMIFSSNTKVNTALVKLFKDAGLNARGYDSKSKGVNRKELISWFKREPDAILLNVGVFTTGFDCKEVQSIILNRATTSLALYLQMVGRGGRITDKIYKPFFKVVDLGGNLARFGKWSDPRDWAIMFNQEEVKKVQKSDVEPLQECDNCGALVASDECEFCGHVKVKGVFKGGKIELVPLDELPPPNAEKIINYVEKTGGGVNKAREILAKYLVDMVICAGTSTETLIRTYESGEMRVRLKRVVTPIYFAIQRSKLEGNRVRTLEYYLNFCEKKIKKLFEK